MLGYTDGISNTVSLVSPWIVYNELDACWLLPQTHKNMIIANEFVCTPPYTPAADHLHLPSLPVSSKMTPTLFYEMENIDTSNSASWGGFKWAGITLFCSIFRVRWLIYRTRETFGSLTVIKTLYFSYVLVSLSVKLTVLAEDLYLS